MEDNVKYMKGERTLFRKLIVIAENHLFLKVQDLYHE